jgi:hypothetical protein
MGLWENAAWFGQSLLLGKPGGFMPVLNPGFEYRVIKFRICSFLHKRVIKNTRYSVHLLA